MFLDGQHPNNDHPLTFYSSGLRNWPTWENKNFILSLNSRGDDLCHGNLRSTWGNGLVCVTHLGYFRFSYHWNHNFYEFFLEVWSRVSNLELKCERSLREMRSFDSGQTLRVRSHFPFASNPQPKVNVINFLRILLINTLDPLGDATCRCTDIQGYSQTMKHSTET